MCMDVICIHATIEEGRKNATQKNIQDYYIKQHHWLGLWTILNNKKTGLISYSKTAIFNIPLINAQSPGRTTLSSEMKLWMQLNCKCNLHFCSKHNPIVTML